MPGHDLVPLRSPEDSQHVPDVLRRNLELGRLGQHALERGAPNEYPIHFGRVRECGLGRRFDWTGEEP
jgi:hypothetical protein